MIQSMTAFARSELKKKKIAVVTEIRSYNSRHLDIVLRIHQHLLVFEDKIKKLVSSCMARGRLEVYIQIKEDPNETYSYELNQAKAEAYHKALSKLKKMVRIDTNIALDLLVSAGDIIKPVEEEKELDIYWPIIEESLIKAITDLNEMRGREGAYISKDIKKRLRFISDNIDQIKDETKDLIKQYQNRLKERITSLTDGMVELDADRVAQEAAILADKSDISEEIVRVSSHLNQFFSIMDSGEPAGRKLNFLLQELNREFNTIGSKVGKANVSHMIVDIKSELEKIREQIQNVE